MSEGVGVLCVGVRPETVAELSARFDRESAAVEGVRSASSALDRFGEGVDGVVVGTELSGGDVAGFVADVRERDADLPIVLLSTAPDGPAARAAADSGVTGCVRRDRADVADRVYRRLLAGFDTERPSVPPSVRPPDRGDGPPAAEGADGQPGSTDLTRRLGPLFEEVGDPVAAVRFRDGTPVVASINPAFARAFDVDRTAATDLALDALAAPADPGDTLPFGRPPVEGTTVQETRLRTADGAADFLVREIPLPTGTGDVAELLVLTDVTERADRERTIETLHAVTRELMTDDEVAAVCERVVEAVADLLGESHVAVFWEGDGAGTFEPVATHSPPGTTADPPVFSCGEGIAGSAVQRGETIVVPDATRDDRATGTASEGPTLRGYCAVPVGASGVLAVGSTTVDAFDDHNVDFLETLAANAEAALARTERERELRRQNERLSDFVDVVAHDLRNPLGAAKQSLQLCRETGAADDFETCKRALQRTDAILDDLVALSRQGRLVHGPESVDVARIARTAWGTAPTANATLVVDWEGTIAADPGRLQALFENLFANAVEHGGDDVTVRVGALDDRPGFFVEDDGPGVAPDARDTVFELGYSTAENGTGFGLGIVAGIAEAHGWTASLVEGRDGGARFEISAATDGTSPDSTHRDDRGIGRLPVDDDGIGASTNNATGEGRTLADAGFGADPVAADAEDIYWRTTGGSTESPAWTDYAAVTGVRSWNAAEHAGGVEGRSRSAEGTADGPAGALFRYAPDPIAAVAVVDGEPIVRAVNPAFASTFGRSSDERLADIVGAEELEALAESVRRPPEDPAETELRLETTGGTRDFLARAIVPDADGAPDRYVVFTDVTERADRERTIETLHAVTRDLLAADTIDEVFTITVDAVTEVLGQSHVALFRWNDSRGRLAVARFRYPGEWYEGPGPHDPGEGLTGTVFERGEPIVVGNALQDPRASPNGPEEPTIRGFAGFPLGEYGVLSVAHSAADPFDGYELRFLETLAANAEAALARTERERELRRQNERLDEFVDVVAHDLRSPLGVASTAVSLAEETGDPDHLDSAERALSRAGEIVEDLLSLARRGSVARNPERVDLARIARAAWETIRTGEADLAVEWGGHLRADESRLRELLENCFRNAVVHGGEDVVVRVGAIEDETGVGFYVADDGPGIPPEERESVFDPGYSTAETGTGIGLGIVRRVAGAHGWSVRVVESESGGARFEFRFDGRDRADG